MSRTRRRAAPPRVEPRGVPARSIAAAGSAFAMALLVGACGGGESDDPTTADTMSSGSQVPGPDQGAPDPGPGTVDPVTTTASPLADPAPDLDEPGEYGCEDCPDGDVGELRSRVSASATRLEGLIEGAIGNGEYYVVAGDGSSIAGTIPTTAGGAWTLDLPLFCGVQIVKCIWSNEAGRYVLVTEITREDCTASDIQITLDWDDGGQDFELHLLRPDGRLNDPESDCTWTTCVGRRPDWGVPGDPADDPLKDVDDTGEFGPENIFLSSPENGTYRVLVEHWGGGDPGADGRVILNVAGETTVATVTDLGSQFVWSVGSIDWPSGEVTLDGDTFDCNDSWASGCRAELVDP